MGTFYTAIIAFLIAIGAMFLAFIIAAVIIYKTDAKRLENRRYKK